MEIQTMIKINRAIEYIRRDPEFPFDTHDDVDEILAYYDIDPCLGPEARTVMVTEVRKIAEEAQSCEIARITLEDIEWMS